MKHSIPITLIGSLAALLVVGFEAGKTAYTKHYETAVLKDPQPMAPSIATLPYAVQVKITSLQGRWANITTTNGDGWIYLGNLSEDKPAADHSVDWLRASADETTASVAARPLDNVTKEYAGQKGMNSAADDLQWLQTQGDKLDKKTVADYLKASRKGEYQ